MFEEVSTHRHSRPGFGQRSEYLSQMDSDRQVPDIEEDVPLEVGQIGWVAQWCRHTHRYAGTNARVRAFQTTSKTEGGRGRIGRPMIDRLLIAIPSSCSRRAARSAAAWSGWITTMLELIGIST